MAAMSEETVVIQTASCGDVAAILAMQRRAFEQQGRLYDCMTMPPLVETVAEVTAAMEQWTVLKAVRDGQVVGAVRGRVDDDGVCHIGRLAVEPSCQGNGLGSRLMAAIEGTFPQAVRYELFTGHLSESNLRLYARLGYVETSRRPTNGPVIIVTMVKDNPLQSRCHG